MKIIISLFCFISNTKLYFPLHLYLCSVCPFTYSFVKYCFVILSLCLFVSLSLSLSLTFSVFRPDLQHFFGIFISFFVPQIWNLNRWRKKNLLSEALTDEAKTFSLNFCRSRSFVLSKIKESTNVTFFKSF